MPNYTLYLKVHNKTGLRYLGQTSRDPYDYVGSGIDWFDHLKTHGRDIDTTVLFTTDSKLELQRVGRYYSELWHVTTAVDNYGNRIWANRIPETAGGHSPRLRGVSETLCPHCNNSYTKKYIDHHIVTCRANPNRVAIQVSQQECEFCHALIPSNVLNQHTKSCDLNPNRTAHHNTGRIHKTRACKHCNVQVTLNCVSAHEKNCSKNPNRIDGHNKGKTWVTQESTCEYCGFTGRGANMVRFHHKNCYLNVSSPRYNPNKKVRRRS